jgi:MraZ protein
VSCVSPTKAVFSLLFLSTIINKIDKKGRVSVPASFRAALEGETFQGVVVFPAFHVAALEACSYSRMETMSKATDNLGQFSVAQDDLTASLFAAAHPLNFDSEGRISLPLELLTAISVTTEIAFVGRGATFQLWEPKAFQAHQAALQARLKIQPPTLQL